MDTMPVGEQTQAQQQVGMFATTQDDYARMERNASLRRITALLGTQQPGRVHYEVMRTYLRQVRILGLGYVGIPGRPYDEGGPLP